MTAHTRQIMYRRYTDFLQMRCRANAREHQHLW